ncbi:MAG TPA: hypothetical protein VF397_13400 [Pyrinomonadaceae bacterium]
MKTILRPMMAALFLLAFTMPLFAQNPNMAIRFEATHGHGEYCAKGTLKNMRTTDIGVSYIELWIYDAKNCKRVCVTRKVINQKVKPCDTMDFELCCKNMSPAFVDGIYYVRVHHSAGMNEAWGFA